MCNTYSYINMQLCFNYCGPAGLEVIKLEYSLMIRLKIKRNDWMLADTCTGGTCSYGVKKDRNIVKIHSTSCKVKRVDKVAMLCKTHNTLITSN